MDGVGMLGSLTLAQVRGRPVVAAGDGVAGGHWHLLPHLGIRVQTGTL